MDDDCPFLAGALAYQIFFALIPLLALMVGALAFVFGDEDSTRQVARLLRDIYPSATNDEIRIVRQLIEGRALSLGLGLIGTVFGASAIYGSLDSALAAVLGRGVGRSFAGRYAAALGLVAAVMAIAVISFGVSYGATAAQDALRAAGISANTRTTIGFLGALLGTAGGFVFFYVVYRYVPRSRPPGRLAAGAALVSAVLWELAKLGFGVFTRALGVFSAYGPLALAAGLLTWIYLTGAIILIGTEVMKVGRPGRG